MAINPLFGRGYIAGVDLQEQRKTNSFNRALVEKRQEEERKAELQDRSLSKNELRERERARRKCVYWVPGDVAGGGLLVNEYVWSASWFPAATDDLALPRAQAVHFSLRVVPRFRSPVPFSF